MDVIWIGGIVGAMVLSAVAAYLVSKGLIVRLMDKLDKGKAFIENHMDILPVELRSHARNVINMIDEVKASFADGKVSFVETMKLAKMAYELYKEFMKVYDAKVGKE